MLNEFDNFRKGLVLARKIYKEGIEDLGFNNYQSFSFLYDEISYYLNPPKIIVRYIAYNILFFCAYENHVNFIFEDPFTADTLKELKTTYKEFYSDKENLKHIPDMQDEESQKIIQIVKKNYVDIQIE